MLEGIALKVAQWFLGEGFKTLADAYKAKLAAGNTTERITADLAARELAVQQRETEVQSDEKRALIGHPLEPTNLLGYIMVAYLGKCIVWDKVIGSFAGHTDNIFRTDSITDPSILYWAGMIMLFYVGKRGFENVAKILKRK